MKMSTLFDKINILPLIPKKIIMVKKTYKINSSGVFKYDVAIKAISKVTTVNLFFSS